MTEDQLQRALKSVGLTAFVTHLALFRSQVPHGDAAAALQQRTGWTASACRTRVTNARRIIAHGREKDALALIAASTLPEEVRRAATRAQ